MKIRADPVKHSVGSERTLAALPAKVRYADKVVVRFSGKCGVFGPKPPFLRPVQRTATSQPWQTALVFLRSALGASVRDISPCVSDDDPRRVQKKGSYGKSHDQVGPCGAGPCDQPRSQYDGCIADCVISRK